MGPDRSTRSPGPSPASTVAALTCGLALFATAARRSRKGTVSPGEEHIFRACNRAADVIVVPVWPVMQMGSLGGALGVAAAFGLAGKRVTAAAVAASGTGIWAGVKLMKPLVGRGRPARHLAGVQVRGKDQTGLGFPSGHSAVSLTVAMIGSRAVSPRAAAALYAASATSAVSRMYVGAHLPLDVLGGVGLGLITGALTVAFLDRLQEPQPSEAIIPSSSTGRTGHPEQRRASRRSAARPSSR